MLGLGTSCEPGLTWLRMDECEYVLATHDAILISHFLLITGTSTFIGWMENMLTYH